MTTQEMLNLLTQRTKITNQDKLLNELKVAYQWAEVEIFKSGDGPEMLMTVGRELTLAATTRDYDLETALTGGALLGLRQLWVKLPTDTNFVKMSPRSIDDDDFAALDNQVAANPAIASGHPVYYAVVNFGKLRFTPALPATSILRADYSMLGASPDPITNPTFEDGTDIPSLFHSAIVYQAAVPLCITLDDDRAAAWASLAVSTLTSAIYAAGKARRAGGPVQTRGWRRGNRRRGI